MILSSHIIVATAAALPLAAMPITDSNAAIIFIAAFCSHYALDLIPHWDYNLSSIKTCYRGEKNGYIKKDKIKIDFIKMAFDGLFGILVSSIIISLSPISISDKIIALFIITPASILPDFIETIYIFFKKQPISFLHKIHLFFHRKNIFMGEPLKGILLQIATVSAIVISLLFVF